MHAVETSHFWFVGTRRVVMSTLRKALGGAVAGARVLDVGCGTGYTLTCLPEGVRAVGLDLSRASATFAKERAPSATIVRAKAGELPFADASFDAVLALDVLEHLDDDLGAAREIARVLRPGAPAVIAVPAMQFLWSDHDVALDHKRRYRLSEIVSVLERAGLRVEVSTYYNTLLFPLIALATLMGRRGEGVQTPAAPLNSLLTSILGAERFLVPRFRLPVGVSCLVVARR